MGCQLRFPRCEPRLTLLPVEAGPRRPERTEPGASSAGSAYRAPGSDRQPSLGLPETGLSTKLLAMKKTRASHLIHSIVETGEIRRSDRSEWSEVGMASLREALERSLNRGRHGGAVSLGGDWSIVARASLPGGRLSVRLYPPEMFPGGACASSMSVTCHPGEPPALWASRAGIHLAPDPWRAATRVRDLEVGLAWAWIPLVEAWVDQDWARTLDPQGECRGHDGGEIDEEGESDEEDPDEQYEDYDEDHYDPARDENYYVPGYDGADIDEEGEPDEEERDEQYEDYYDDYCDFDPWGGADSPWDWAPVDVTEAWGLEEGEVWYEWRKGEVRDWELPELRDL